MILVLVNILVEQLIFKRKICLIKFKISVIFNFLNFTLTLVSASWPHESCAISDDLIPDEKLNFLMFFPSGVKNIIYTNYTIKAVKF